MLKKIPTELSPELLKILMEMGHGDEIVIADGNFPAASLANRLVRADGMSIPILLKSILELFPLDKYVTHPIGLMKVVPGDKIKPKIWLKYKKIIKESGEKFDEFKFIERFEFYERAKKAYAVIATSELELYANVILKKGIVDI
jgi:L-fucose mutarotase